MTAQGARRTGGSGDNRRRSAVRRVEPEMASTEDLETTRPASGAPTPGGTEPEAADQEVTRLRAALKAQSSTLRQLVAIHDRLSGLVLQGADVAAISALLSELIGRRVLLLDGLLGPVAVAAGGGAAAAADWSPNEAYVQRVLRTLAEDRRPLRVPPVVAFGVAVACVVAPIVVGDAVFGHLVILDNRPDDVVVDADGEIDVLVVQHAATVYALAMMRERIAAEVTRQLRNELLEGLLLAHLSDPEEVRQRAVRIGFTPGLPHHVIVMSPEDTAAPLTDAAADARSVAVRRRRLLEGLAEMVGSRARDAIVSPRLDDLVVIVPVSEEPRQGPKALGRSAIQHASALFSSWSLTVGVGGLCRQPTEIAMCYGQARRAVEAARRFGRRGEVVAFEELGLYRLLFQVQNPAELDGFVTQVLGDLIAYDAKHQSEFVQTLAAYLQQNGSPQATARELDVHVNTVAYRLQRIKTISGLNLDQSEDRLLAQVALKIVEGTGPGG